MPHGAATAWELTAPWSDQRVKRLHLAAGKKKTIVLEPFEVLVFDAVPAAPAGG